MADAPTEKPFDPRTMKSITVRVTDIIADQKFNARKASGLSKESIEELATLIKKEGLLQQYCVRAIPDKPGKYSVVFGFRRHAAMKLLNAETVEVKLLEPRKGKEDKADRDAIMANFVENVGREDLLPWELAERAVMLHEEYGLSTAEIEAATCKSSRLINNYTRTLRNLDPRVWNEGFKLIGLEEKQGAVTKPVLPKGGTNPVGAAALIELAALKVKETDKDGKKVNAKDKDGNPIPDHAAQWQEFKYLAGIEKRPEPPAKEPPAPVLGEDGKPVTKPTLPWNDACQYIGAKPSWEAYKALERTKEKSQEWRKGAREMMRYILGMTETCPITVVELGKDGKPAEPKKKANGKEEGADAE